MVLWLRICQPMQRTPVQPLVWENPHASGQLSPHTTCLSSRAATTVAYTCQSLCSTREAHALQLENGPCSSELKQMQQGRQHSKKINFYREKAQQHYRVVITFLKCPPQKSQRKLASVVLYSG